MSTHLRPVDDAFDHELAADCPCGPRLVKFDAPNGTGHAYEHHPLIPCRPDTPADGSSDKSG